MPQSAHPSARTQTSDPHTRSQTHHAQTRTEPPSTPAAPRHVHLAVDLSDAGARPADWRDVGSRAAQPFDLDRLLDLVGTAQRGTLDFVVFDDTFALRPRSTGASGGRLDAALVSARLAPRTAGLGLVAALDPEHTDPVHVAQAVTAVDAASAGRAGWQVGTTGSPGAGEPDGSALGGVPTSVLDEAVETVVRHWAAGTGDVRPEPGRARAVDVDGVPFVVRSPARRASSAVRPVVVLRADGPAALAVAGRHADVVRVRAGDRQAAVAHRREIREAARHEGRTPDEVRVLVDVVAVLGPDRASARARLDLLREIDGTGWDTGSLIVAGTPQDLAALVADWVDAGAADGFVVRPGSVQTDLVGLVDGVVPLLRAAGRFRRHYPGTTLRHSLGVPEAAPRAPATV